MLMAAALLWMAALTGYDIRQGRLPNWLTLPGFAVILLVAAVSGHGAAAALGAGLLTAVYLLIHAVAPAAMGAGDVKLMAAVGSLAGASKILEIALAGAIGGGFLAVGYMIYHRKVGVTLRNVIDLLQFHRMHGAESHPEINLSNPAALRMPYGIAIAAGVLYSFCMIFAGR